MADIRAAFTITAGVVGQEKVDKLNASLRDTGRIGEISARQTAAAMRTLPAQFTDIATQLAGGQNPFLILLQQGGQIKDSFGGIVPAARALASVLTPVRLLMGGVAGAIGAVAFAAVQGSREMDALSRSMALTNNYAGQTIDGINAAVQRLRATTGVTAGTARELIGGAVGSGAFGVSSIDGAIQAMGRLQKISQASADDIVKDFASMQKGVASWAAEHNRTFNYLTADQFKYIQQLEKMGRADEAMRENLRLLNEALASRKVELGLLERSWEAVKEKASAAWDAMKGIGKAETVSEKLARLQKELKQIEDMKSIAAGLPSVTGGRTSPREAAIRSEIAAIREQIDAEDIAAAAASRRMEKERRAIEDLASGKTMALQQAADQLRQAQAEAASARRIQVLEQEQARIDALQRAGLISDAEYNRQKNEIERATLAERIALAQQEIELEKKRSVKDDVDAAQRRVKLVQLQAQLNAAISQAAVAATLAAAPPKSGFGDSIKSLNEELARLQYQNQHVAEFGDKIMSAREAVMAFDIEAGKFGQLTEAQKQQLIGTARAIDAYATALQRAMAGIDYDNQTKKLEAENRALGQTNLQRQIGLALQDLENKGIREGTELYTQLAERRIEALTKAYDAQRDFNLGLRQGFNDMMDLVNNQAQQARDAFVNAFRAMEDALVQFTLTGKLNFADMARSIIADIARIIVRQQIMTPLLKSLGGWFPSIFGGGGGGGGGGAASIASLLPSAKGNAFGPAGVMAFANGGVVSKPTLLPLAGEAGPEAILPLQRGADGKLGVASTGGGGVVVNVTVNAETGAVQTGGDQGALAGLGQRIGQLVRQEIIDQKRPGGLLAA